MATKRFEELALGLAQRDRGLLERVQRVAEEMSALRARAARAVDAFRRVAAEQGATHLTHLEVGPVEPDEKHVDCLQFKIRRGRFELVCVGKPRGAVVLVGPYRTGRPERPCEEHALPSPEAEAAMDELVLRFLCEASAR